MACEQSAYGTLISSSEKCDEMEVNQNECQKLIESCYKNSNISTSTSLFTQESTDKCALASSVCNVLVVKPIIDATKLNIYDIRKQCQGNKMIIGFT